MDCTSNETWIGVNVLDILGSSPELRGGSKGRFFPAFLLLSAAEENTFARIWGRSDPPLYTGEVAQQSPMVCTCAETQGV